MIGSRFGDPVGAVDRMRFVIEELDVPGGVIVTRDESVDQATIAAIFGRVAAIWRNEGVEWQRNLRDPCMPHVPILAHRTIAQAVAGEFDFQLGPEILFVGIFRFLPPGRFAVQDACMSGIDRTLDRLRVIAFVDDLEGLARTFRHVEPREVRERRFLFLGAHIGPHHPTGDACGIGLYAHGVGQLGILGLRGRIHALAAHVELPAVKQAAQAAIAVDAKRQRRAAVGAMLVQQTDSAFAIAEGDQIFTQQADANGLSVVLRQLAFKQSGHPIAAQNLAHRGAGAGVGEEFVVFAGKHEPLRLLVNCIFYII